MFAMYKWERRIKMRSMCHELLLLGYRMCMITLIASLIIAPCLFASTNPNEDSCDSIALSIAQSLIGLIVFKASLAIYIERERKTIFGDPEQDATPHLPSG